MARAPDSPPTAADRDGGTEAAPGILRRWALFLGLGGISLYLASPADSAYSAVGASLLMLATILALSSAKVRTLVRSQRERRASAQVLAQWAVDPLAWRRYVRHLRRERFSFRWEDALRFLAVTLPLPALTYWETRSLVVALGLLFVLLGLMAGIWLVRARAADRMLDSQDPAHAEVVLTSAAIHITADQVMWHVGPGTPNRYQYRVKSVEVVGHDPTLLRLELRLPWSAFSNMMRRLRVDLPGPPGGRDAAMRVRSAILQAAAGSWPSRAVLDTTPPRLPADVNAPEGESAPPSNAPERRADAALSGVPQ